MRQWKRTRQQRANEAAQGVDFWFRQHYQLPPNDPRYLNSTWLERHDEFYAYQAYQRLLKGEPMQESYESGLEEDDILAELDELTGGSDWEDVPASEDDIMRALEGITDADD